MGHRRVLRPARHTRVCLRGRVLRRWPHLRAVARRAPPNRSRMSPLVVFVASHLHAWRNGSVSLPLVIGSSPAGFIPESRRLTLSVDTPPRQTCASWRSRRTKSPLLAQLDTCRRAPLLTSFRACGLVRSSAYVLCPLSFVPVVPPVPVRRAIRPPQVVTSARQGGSTAEGCAAGDAQEKRCRSGVRKPRMGACGWQTANAGGTDTAPVWALPAAHPVAHHCRERSRTLTRHTHGHFTY